MKNILKILLYQLPGKFKLQCMLPNDKVISHEILFYSLSITLYKVLRVLNGVEQAKS